MVKALEGWYLALLTIGIGYVVLRNSSGAASIIRESGQGVSNLTKVASGGGSPVFGYSVLGG